MASILILEPNPSDAEYVRAALVEAGHDARQATGSEDFGAFDALVVDLQVGIDRQWFRPSNPAPLPQPPLVVTSAFAAFLEKISGRVAATVLKPASQDTLRAAVARALGDGAPVELATVDFVMEATRDEFVASLPGSDAELSAIADLVARGLGTPMGLVTFINSTDQVFAGQSGLPADLATAGATPRSWSFCQHAVSAGTNLVVEDARAHPLLAGTPLVETNLVLAYAGVPIDVDGAIVGTVCALSDKPRSFQEKDLATLQLAARLVGERLSRLARQRAAEEKSAAPARTPPPLLPVSLGGLAVGDMLDDKYWITARLGAGGLSDVLLARDRVLGQLVAIKVMRKRDGDETLLREATALARVRHPNIVQVHGWGRTAQGQLYLVLEYVSGESLEDRRSAASTGAEPLDTSFALKVLRELGGALATLHAAGIIHGDVKPDNVIVDFALDRAVLIDFGLGLGGDMRGGTPGYSAPEQFTTAPMVPGPALDVYALGAVAYAMLTGKDPFDEVEGLARVALQMIGQVKPPSSVRPDLPPGIDAVVLRALDADPKARFDSVLALGHALEEVFTARILSPARSIPPGEIPRSRGHTYRRVRAEVTARVGAAGEAAIVLALAEEDRQFFSGGAQEDAAWYPTAPLLGYLKTYAGGDLAKLEVLGSAVTSRVLPELLRVITVARTPSTLLHIASPLFYRFHDWGKVEIVRTGTQDATLTFEMPKGHAPTMCHFMSGSLIALLRFAGTSPHVRHERCMALGAGACELRVGWDVR